ncbi:mercuric transport protein MerTP [Neolewinella agarilytica]|uniref:Mercuric transport protein MerT n=1 Tax=Neolewinella agarilytica TaxID=478744 RepID=A0A1H9H4U7_9BACT|nr:mercuric transport protein MerTP [Neolewinella agarilytica]SEQ57323.1 Copper chaperone CopZ [Neolewinella agarilytica]
MKKETLASSTGLLAAVAASLCCIAPILVLVSGSTILLSGFSWIAPLRPYLIGASALALGAAWYFHLRSTPVEDCDCPPENRSLLQSRGFLTVVSVLAVVFLAIPSFTGGDGPVAGKSAVLPTGQGQLMTATFLVEGMTCGGCEKHVSDAVYGVAGVVEIEASYAEKNTVVTFDAAQTDAASIAAAIATTGYTVTDYTAVTAQNNTEI